MHHDHEHEGCCHSHEEGHTHEHHHEHYGLADKVQNSHRAIDDVLALYEVTKAMSKERDDLTDYIDLLGYNPKYGITGRKLRQITYMPQSYKLGRRLPDLMNGGGSCE